MDELGTTVGIVALAAAATAVVALACAVALALRLRRLRSAQSAVLGGREGTRDLVAHAAQLQEAFRLLQDRVDEIAAHLGGRLDGADARLDGALAYRGLVRFDAYNELSGRQSTAIALLDATHSGIVVSSIHHRDQARVYAKQVVAGQSAVALGPEEEEAVRRALTGDASELREG